MTGINAILNEISEKSNDQSLVSNNKIKLEERAKKDTKAIVEEKKSGKFQLVKNTEKTKSSSISSKKTINWTQNFLK